MYYFFGIFVEQTNEVLFSFIFDTNMTPVDIMCDFLPTVTLYNDKIDDST